MQKLEPLLKVKTFSYRLGFWLGGWDYSWNLGQQAGILVNRLGFDFSHMPRFVGPLVGWLVGLLVNQSPFGQQP